MESLTDLIKGSGFELAKLSLHSALFMWIYLLTFYYGTGIRIFGSMCLNMHVNRMVAGWVVILGLICGVSWWMVTSSTETLVALLMPRRFNFINGIACWISDAHILAVVIGGECNSHWCQEDISSKTKIKTGPFSILRPSNKLEGRTKTFWPSRVHNQNILLSYQPTRNENSEIMRNVMN